MKDMKNIEKIGAIIIVLGIIIFNIYLHRAELTIKSDPNDNIFQYALVDEAKNILTNIAHGKLSIFYLVDSFNGRWNEGFSLSTYYSHLPQAFIAFTSLVSGVDAYTLLRLLKFLMLVLLPLSFFLGARILRQSYIYATLAALISHLIFTNGFYGIDISSFLWRGWGLSGQLFAVFFLPLAFSYGITYLNEGKNLGKAIFFNFLLGQLHSGIFVMTAMAYPLILIFNLKFEIFNEFLNLNFQYIKRFFIFVLLLFFSLSYFFVPFFLQGQYRNFSFWDPAWKFNSFGLNQVVIWFFNGELFDYGRLPIITLFVALGVFYSLVDKNRVRRLFGVLFIFYLILFFGRSTLGPLINLLPGMSEFHLHRFIVMVHLVGVFVAAGILESAVLRLGLPAGRQVALSYLGRLGYLGAIVLILASLFFLEKPIINYSKDNAVWIERSNKSYQKDVENYTKLVNKLKSLPPARVYAGRPGDWGRDFKIGDTQIYMALSRDGFYTVGFSPESWSPNSEYDQFMDDGNASYLNLYNIGYLVFPSAHKIPQNLKLIEKFGKYELYRNDTDGWFGFGTSQYSISAQKNHLLNITRIWQSSELLKNSEYPTPLLPLQSGFAGVKEIKMLDLNEWEDKSGEKNSLWQKSPFSQFTTSFKASNFKKINEEVSMQTFKIKFKMLEDCSNCIVVLKNTYHPNWQVRLNGPTSSTTFSRDYVGGRQNANIFPVLPYYIGIPVHIAGEYTLEATYKPNGIKVFLLVVSVLSGLGYLSYLASRRIGLRGGDDGKL